jgi:hypothetical protein
MFTAIRLAIWLKHKGNNMEALEQAIREAYEAIAEADQTIAEYNETIARLTND